MRKVEKVTIGLPNAKTESPPVKYCKTRNGRPVCSNFELVPKSFPQLKAFFRSVKWNSVAKTLKILLYETPRFEAMKWIEYVSDQHDQMQKSPFVDTDSNVALLTFVDEYGNQVAEVRFKNLSLVSHKCDLYKEDDSLLHLECCVEDAENYDDSLFGFLVHRVILNYQYAEIITPESESKTPDLSVLIETDNKELDNEWQTVEAP